MTGPLRITLVLIVGLLFTAGCRKITHKLEMATEGPVLVRQYTQHDTSRNSGDEVPNALVNPAFMKRLEELYDAPVHNDKAEVIGFHGKFARTTPNDVGDAGRYIYLESTLGSTAFYIERFGGSNDPAAQLDQLRQTANEATDLAAAWLKSELGREPGYPQLEKFINTQVRRDLTNFALWLWAFRVAQEEIQADPGYDEDSDKDRMERLGSGIAARALLYLTERDYLRPEDLSRWKTGDARQMFTRLVARRMGIADHQPLPRSFRALYDKEVFEESLKNFLIQSESFKSYHAAWLKAHPDEAGKEPSDVLSEFFADKLDVLTSGSLQVFKATETLESTLKTLVRPAYTNGRWIEADKQVRWSVNVRSRHTIPTICFAAWAVPDANQQRNRFGKVILNDDRLIEYVLWLNALTEKQASQWEKFLLTLKPGDDLKSRVADFNFSPPVDDAGLNGAEVITEAIEEARESK